MRDPTTVGVTVTEQDPACRIQFPPGVMATLPVGVLGVPAEASRTVTVQDVGWLTATLDGLQAMLVDVCRGLTVRVVPPEVLRCPESPP